MANEDMKEMQNEELQAIQAIYMDDYIDKTEDSSSPPEIILKLTPLQSVTGKEVHANVDLRVKYTSHYPYDPPILKIENAKGISDKQLSMLKVDLDKMASNLCGEVMVLQLAQYVQSILHQYNVPNLSFFEQMLANQQKQEQLQMKEQEKQQEAKDAEDRERDQDVIRQVKEELVKREEVMKQEKRKRQVSMSLGSPNTSSTLLQGIDTTETSKLPLFVCLVTKERKIAVYTFRNKSEDKKVFCSACIGHYFENACTYTAIEESTGKQMSLCEWKCKSQISKKKVHFVDNNGDATEAINKQVQSIEQEFSFLKSKVSCRGITNYYAMEIEHNASTFNAKLLIDPITGSPLNNFLQEGGLPLQMIQSIGKQIVDILLYLHRKGVVHRDLNLCNTFMDSNNEVTLSGYAVMKRLSDLRLSYSQDEQNFQPGISQDYQKVRACKKGDVFNTGLILLHLFEGKRNTSFPVEIPEKIPDSFQDFLKSCLVVDEDQRSSMQELSKHSFLHEKINNSPIVQNSFDSLHDNSRAQHSKHHEDNIHLPFFNDNLVLAKSRLINEFKVMKWLGKGGFGSVIEVQNKLDGNLYAIKRIPLNPKSLHLNKRITREVKLLSRLNHENVVRYYNSWIEAEDIKLLESSTDTELISSSPQQNPSKPKNIVKEKRTVEESLLELNNFDKSGIHFKDGSSDSSWCDDGGNDSQNTFSSSSSSSEEEQSSRSKSKIGNKNIKRSQSRSGFLESSEGIVFQMDDSVLQFGDLLDSEDSDDDNGTITTTTTETSSGSVPSLQYLYIQMEYCEKNTLRIVIDECLYKEPDRVWRYFREIVEGLAHVHAQGIIHRDLKPFNIFMDHCNRIKIGDFGLATSHNTAKIDSTVFLKDVDSLQSTDDVMTGKVGTALYVAPELCKAESRVKFSEKVDMYSLGIILFEMCYRPLNTGMERVKTLGSLRTENVVFPDDFNCKKFARDHFVISWLLDHNPDSRPTAKELLESGYVPLKFEDSKLDELLKHTLSQTNSTRYQRLMSELFSQPVSPVVDQIYDSDLHGKNETYIIDSAEILQYVKNIVTRIFLKHGAVYIETPLLLPKSKTFHDLNYVASFIDQSGLQLCLPYDSRISFARLISRNKITNLRRFFFGKLYRNSRVIGAHPISLWECSCDIVTNSSSNTLPIAELIYIVHEVIKAFPSLQNRNFYIRLNHSSLIQAIFVQNNISEETQNQIFKIIECTKNNKEREEFLHNFFTEMKLADHVVNKLVMFLNFEGSISKAKEVLQILRKSKASVSNLAKQAFQDIDRLIKHLVNFGIDIPIYICTSHINNISYYSGVFFQLVAPNTRKRKHGGVDILAAGGCYDRLVESLSKYAETTNLPTSVGISIAVEKLLLAATDDKHFDENIGQQLCECNVIVCSVTNTSNFDALVQVLHELWSANISATLYSYELNQNNTVEEIQEYCIEHGINHLAILKESDLENVRVKSREKEKFVDNRVPRPELCDYLLQRISNKHDSKEVEQVSTKPTAVMYQQSEPSVSFTFVSVDKIEANKKRLFINVFITKFQHELQQTFGGNDVQIVAARLERSELKSVAAYLELKGSYDDFESSLKDIMKMYKDQGGFMKRVCNTLYQVYSDSHSVVILYSYKAELYKIVS